MEKEIRNNEKSTKRHVEGKQPPLFSEDLFSQSRKLNQKSRQYTKGRPFTVKYSNNSETFV